MAKSVCLALFGVVLLAVSACAQQSMAGDSNVVATLNQCQIILGSMAAGDGTFDKDTDFAATMMGGTFNLPASALTNASEDVLYVVPAARSANYAPLTAASATTAGYCYDTTTLLPQYNPLAAILPEEGLTASSITNPTISSDEVTINPITTLLAFGWAYGLRADTMAQALGIDQAIEASSYNGLQEFENDPVGSGSTFYKVGVKLQNLVTAGATFLTNTTDTYASFAVLMDQSIGRAALNASNYHWLKQLNGSEASLDLQDPASVSFIIFNAAQYVHASKDWTLPSMLNQLPAEFYTAVSTAIANLNQATDDVSSLEELTRVAFYGQNMLPSHIEDLITSSMSMDDFYTATSPSSISSALANSQLQTNGQPVDVPTTSTVTVNTPTTSTSSEPTSVKMLDTQAQETSSDSGSSLSGGAIAGIVIGCVVGVALIALVVALVVKSAAGSSGTPLWGRRAAEPSTTTV